MEPTTTPDPGALTDAPATVFDTLRALIDAGGPVVLILAGLSVLMLATTFLKAGQFLRLGVWRRGHAHHATGLQRRGRTDHAAVAAGAGKGIAARIVAQTLHALATGHDRAEAREEAHRQIDEVTERLQSNLRILEIIASLAPLLGLFGTVLGMIEAFQQLEASGSRADPSILSGGIWEALLTTAVGLAVAMPSVVLVNLFDRTVESFTRDTENMVAQIFIPPTPQDAARHGMPADRHQSFPTDDLATGCTVPAGE